ncbi:hypothetical protein ACFWMG_41210, partial [Streptomyces sp. NPDC127074]
MDDLYEEFDDAELTEDPGPPSRRVCRTVSSRAGHAIGFRSTYSKIEPSGGGGPPPEGYTAHVNGTEVAAREALGVL